MLGRPSFVRPMELEVTDRGENSSDLRGGCAIRLSYTITFAGTRLELLDACLARLRAAAAPTEAPGR